MNMFENLGELFVAMSILDEIYPKLRDINDECTFLSLIGSIIDSWCSDHGKGSEDRNKMLAIIFHIGNLLDKTKEEDDSSVKS